MFSMICLVIVGSTIVPSTCSYMCTKVVYRIQLINERFDGTLNYILTMDSASDTSDNEIYTFKEMLQQLDKNKFIMAMMKEIQDHEKR